MSAIERVMKAYTRKHDLNPEQAALVRAELSRFIGELMSGTGAASITNPDIEKTVLPRDK